MYDISGWRHIFKLDPAKPISEAALRAVCTSETDAIVIGGTDQVTERNVSQLKFRVRRYSKPVALELSQIDSIVPGFDAYLIPTVLNSPDVTYHNGILFDALKTYGHLIDFDDVVFEGYIVLNPNSKVGEVTQAETHLTSEDVETYAQMIESMYRLPVIYIEYSGTYGDIEKVKAAAEILSHTQLVYGGGITNLEEAQAMATHAHTIVVGNIIYEDLNQALKTVKIKELPE